MDGFGALKVARAWRRMAKGGAVDAVGLREEILDSWRKSRASDVDPYNWTPAAAIDRAEAATSAYKKRLWETERLFEAAAIELLRLARELSGIEGILVLAGPDQRVLEVQCCGFSQHIRQQASALLGVNLAENRAGTNCIGLASRLKRPVEVRFYEHYARWFHPWAGYGVPILDGDRDRLVGVLAMMAFRSDLPACDLVSKAVERIQARLEHLDAAEAYGVLREFVRSQTRFSDRIIVALDKRGKVLALSTEAVKRLGGAATGAILGNPLDSIRALQVENYRELRNLREPGLAKLALCTDEGEISVDSTAYPVESHLSGSVQAGLVIVGNRPTSELRAAKNKVSPWRPSFRPEDFIGDSPAIKKVLELARKVANSDLPVLLVGETGTGKELLASAIHHLSPRASGPFVALDVSTVPQELVASELFGYEEGAFTGAQRGGRPGKIQLAEQGTLFLDELADLPLNVQAGLLRFLEDRRVVPLGALSPRVVDVRIIAAINSPPEHAVAQKRLRFDLFQRLNVFQIVIPPLRERLEDIPLLVEHFLASAGLVDVKVSGQAMEKLKRYWWPGNVRELRNVILRAALNARRKVIEPSDLVFEQGAKASMTYQSELPSNKRLTKEQVVLALRECGGNKSRAAKRLGVHWVTVYRAIKRWGLEQELSSFPLSSAAPPVVSPGALHTLTTVEAASLFAAVDPMQRESEAKREKE